MLLEYSITVWCSYQLYDAFNRGGMVMIEKFFTSEIVNWFNRNIRINLKTKTSTINVYEYRLNKYIIPFFRGKRVNEVDSEVIQEFVSTLDNERTGSPLAASTVYGIVSILFDFFNYCVEEDIIRYNPCKRVALPKRKRRKVVTLTKRERLAILDQIEKKPQSRSRLVLVALHTGMRLGELSSLRWEYVDLNDRIIKVKTTKARVRNENCIDSLINSDTTINKTKVVITEPKTDDSVREVPVSSIVLRQLEAQKEYDSEYVFPKTNGEGYDNRSIQKYFTSLANSLGIQEKSFHTLRHTFATNALESGMDIKTLSQILGHSNVTTTLDYYIHPNEKYTKKAMEMASSYIGKRQ